jgi:bacterioferritin-associated ferredoxin
MYICHCKAVTDRAVKTAIDAGARSVADVTARCRAGGGCGNCHEVLLALLDASVGPRELADASAP